MTTKRMLLKSTVAHSDTPGMYTVSSQHYDGTPFKIKVSYMQVQLNEPFTEDKDLVDGWLFVEHVGQQADRAFVVLPASSIEYGKNITVSERQLLPPGLTVQAGATVVAGMTVPAGVTVPPGMILKDHLK